MGLYGSYSAQASTRYIVNEYVGWNIRKIFCLYRQYVSMQAYVIRVQKE